MGDGRGGARGSGSRRSNRRSSNGIGAAADAAPPSPRTHHCRSRRRHPLLPACLTLLLSLLTVGPRLCDAGIHVSHVIQDGRALIPLSPNFGFDPRGGGSVVATMRGPLVVYRPHKAGDELAPPDLGNFGLILVPSGELREMHARVARGECPLAALAGPAGPDDAAAAQRALYLPLLSFADPGVQAVADNRADNYTLHVEMATGGGWYSLWFASCEAHTPVTFSVRAELFNPTTDAAVVVAGGGGDGQGGNDQGGSAFGPSGRGRNYMSVGYRELDEVYAAFAAAYAAAAAIWLALLSRARFFSGGGGAVARARAGAAAQAAAAGASPDEVAAAARGAPVVRPLHWLMAALVLVKAATLICQAVSVRIVEATGRAEGGWERARLAFYVLRGLFLFCVLVLLASGWSLLVQQEQVSSSSAESSSTTTPILDPATQRVLAAVLPLQAFANVALVVAAEDDATASPGRLTWLHVFRAADLLCCLAVLVPVVLTAAKLRREAEAGDGKARRALDRLVAFRRFYVVFVAWVWATRVASVLLEGAVPLTLAWVAPTVEEGATLLFYAFVGASFRPRAVGESYAHLTDEELAEIEL